ncbi:arylamine N-acetyltransferase, partial [Salmonella enterica subsp. enterica serovar Anatum]|nr:arylamine N-acetyltransferase [Salmonella enterica subsp. enterica serovar Anatum]
AGANALKQLLEQPLPPTAVFCHSDVMALGALSWAKRQGLKVPLLPREIQLDETALEEKLLYARRGGYCFELNGLFERALRDIGF